MATNRFAKYVLRTTDAPAATAFYDAVLGRHDDVVFPLHEQAIARGARAHWLGQIVVADAEHTGAVFLAEGGERYGVRPDGLVVLRDPGGAIVAFSATPHESKAGVVWHVLRSRDAATAAERYAKALGWSLGDEVDLGAEGKYRSFSWSVGEPPAGVVGGVEDTPGVHPQWLYFFGVPSRDAAVAAVRAHGGTVASVRDLPNGSRVAVCDDPQGASFGVMQR